MTHKVMTLEQYAEKYLRHKGFLPYVVRMTLRLGSDLPSMKNMKRYQGNWREFPYPLKREYRLARRDCMVVLFCIASAIRDRELERTCRKP